MVNRIGILGGTGIGTATYFLRLLDEFYRNLHRPSCRQDYPDLTIHIENSLPSLTGISEVDHHAAAQRINRAIASLILSGCDPVIVPSIALHSLVEQRWFDAGVVDFRRSIIDHFEHIDTGPIAVLATQGVIESNIFTRLEDYFDLYYPPDSMQKNMTMLIDGPHGLDSPEVDYDDCRIMLEKVIRDWHKRGVDRFLAADVNLEAFIADVGIDGGIIMPLALMCGDIIESLRQEMVVG